MRQTNFRKRLTLAATIAIALTSARVIGGPPPSQPSQPTMRHVLTADYLRGPSKDTALSPSVVAPWLSWASTSFQLNPAVVAAGIKAMYYTNPNRVNLTNPMYSTDESVFAHTCNGSRITSTSYANMYLTDPSSASALAQWKKIITSRSANRHWDAFFDDDASAVGGLSGLPCNYSPDVWREAHRRQIEALNVPIIYNGLQLQDERELEKAPNVLGGMYEGCYADSQKQPKTSGKRWLDIENMELAMARDKKLFFCLSRDGSNAADAIDGRIYNLASFLLTYSPDSSVLWETYSTPSNFRVEPESALVPLDPLQPPPNNVTSIKVAAGAYAREYERCYFGSAYVRACAIVVNPNNGVATYPFGNKYAHTLVLAGGGVMDNGKASTSGPAPSGTLPALGAVIVFQ